MEEKREPLSEMAIERKIQILRNKHMDSEVIALVKSDYEYGPVSYTHLDVYKRQRQQWRLTDRFLTGILWNECKRGCVLAFRFCRIQKNRESCKAATCSSGIAEAGRGEKAFCPTGTGRR